MGVVLAVVATLALLLGGGGLVAGLAPRPDAGGSTGAWVDALRPARRTPGIQAVLDRRAAAVRARDKAAFLADVDRADEDFHRRQGVLFDNLVRMPLAELEYRMEPSTGYQDLVPDRLTERFHAAVYAPGVTLRYRVDGIDSRPVATPWVPVLGYSGERWLLAGEVTDGGLPYGSNGQAWDTGPIAVVRSDRVVGVFSADDTGRAEYLLHLAEQGLDQVLAVRPTGWDGRVVITAVQDRRIFDAYFADSPDRVAQVAAIAVPYYDQVLDWHRDAGFVTTRVVFNPQQLSAQPEELAHDLTHEFVHAAMGSVTRQQTPRWLVEGFAEYVAYAGERIQPATLRRRLRDATIGETLPADGTFYSDSKNYVTAWLACRMIAERYGRAALVALYESFQQQRDQSASVPAVLGVDLPTLAAQLREYVARIRA